MTENVFGTAAETSFKRRRAFSTIVYGGLVVGVLDLLFAFTLYSLILGVPPLRIFQSVAAGVIGRTAATEGGMRTFLLGIVLHFIVATCIATVYYLASLLLPVLIRYAVLSGLTYGIMAYFGMKYIVLPLSAIGQSGRLPRLPILLTEVVGHALLVGLPIALLTRRSASGANAPIGLRSV
ncbi:MAG TPA: hypothetical protein VFH15_13835 [Pyrinomonadaceae bacterium]|nr:hypothetical protein [Pyrinomonadaceae bacterium]